MISDWDIQKCPCNQTLLWRVDDGNQKQQPAGASAASQSSSRQHVRPVGLAAQYQLVYIQRNNAPKLHSSSILYIISENPSRISNTTGMFTSSVWIRQVTYITHKSYNLITAVFSSTLDKTLGTEVMTFIYVSSFFVLITKNAQAAVWSKSVILSHHCAMSVLN